MRNFQPKYYKVEISKLAMALDRNLNIGDRAFAPEHGYKKGSIEELMAVLNSNTPFFVGIEYSLTGTEVEIDTVSRRVNGDYLLLLHEKPKKVSYEDIVRLVERSQRNGYEPKVYLHLFFIFS